MENEIKNYLEIKKCLILLRYSEYDVTNVTESSQARLPNIPDEAAIIHIPSGGKCNEQSGENRQLPTGRFIQNI